MKTTKHDVLVVGGGIAGMVAAVRAAQAGLKVLVLEKGSEDRYLCNSRYTAGLFHVCSRAVTLPPDELNAIVQAATSGTARPDLQRTIADKCFQVIRWMQGEGVRFIRAGAQEARQWGLAPVNLPQAGLNWHGRAGDVMLHRLEGQLMANGGRVQRAARATALTLTAGRCTGLTAEVDGQTQQFETANVIIADGGFQASPDMLVRFVTDHPEKLMQRCAPTSTGDGLRMCEAAGAQIVASSAFYGHLLGQDAVHNPKLWPYPWFDEIAVVSVVAGSDGARFADEGLGGTYMANQIARLRDPASAVLVFDEAVWQDQGRAALVPPNELYEKHGGIVLRAASVEALAAQLGMPATTLDATIKQHNALASGDTASASAIPRTCTKHQPAVLNTGALYAVRLAAGVTYTMGGIAIDGASRVLDITGHPIPGLLAAGATTGGLEGGGATGYVGGLVKSSVTGYCAAETAIEACKVLA
jgi:fumarate reductase flavoprotein subunit